MNTNHLMTFTFLIGEKVKGDKLTQEEKNEIEKCFKSSSKETLLERTKEAIENVLNKKFPKSLMEESASASLDDLDDLLLQLNEEAEKWNHLN